MRYALVCLFALVVWPDAAWSALRKREGERSALHASPSTTADPVNKEVSATRLLSPKGLQHRVEKSSTFLHQTGRTCDGATDKIVDTAYLNLKPAEVLNQTSPSFAKLHSYCHRVRSRDTACRCYNIMNGTCSMEMGALIVTKDSTSQAFVRVAPAPLDVVETSHSGLQTKAIMGFAAIPQAKCRLTHAVTNALSGLSATNITTSINVVAQNLTSCQKSCIKEACACLEMTEVDASDPSMPDTLACKLYMGAMGQTVFYEMRPIDQSAKMLLTMVPTGLSRSNSHMGKSIVTMKALSKKAGLLQSIEKAAIITVPIILILIISWIICGSPIRQVVIQAYRTAKHVDKPMEELTWEERNALVKGECAEVRMKNNEAVFLTYKREAKNFMGFASDPNNPDRISYPQYAFPGGGDYPYRHEMNWKAVWWVRFRHFFTISGTTLRNCVKPAVLVGSLAALWAWAEVVYFADPLDNGAGVKHFRENMAQVSKLHGHLVTPATFVVMFSLNEALNRWQNVLTTMWAMQDPIQAVGFMLGSGFARAPLAMRPYAFKFYRYLNVIHLLTYAPLTRNLSHIDEDLEDLVLCNLLTRTEANHLVRQACSGQPGTRLHQDGQRRRVLAWMWDNLQDCMKNGVHKRNFGRIEKQFITIREIGSAMGSEFGRDLPFSWGQCTELIVYLVVGLCPFSFTQNMRVEGEQVQIWPALGSMVFAFFFFGMLETIKTVTHAFDGKIDDFDPESHLIETEQALFIAFTEGMDLDYGFKTNDNNNPEASDGAQLVLAAKPKAKQELAEKKPALETGETKGEEIVTGVPVPTE